MVLVHSRSAIHGHRHLLEAMNMGRHGMKYTPWFPHWKIVRTRGVINQTALVVFWMRWVLEIEL